MHILDQINDFRQELATHIGHARLPAIILPDGGEYIAAIGRQGSSKEFSTGPDIEILMTIKQVRKPEKSV